MPRLRTAERRQVEWRPVNLEELVPDDHRVRGFVARIRRIAPGVLKGIDEAGFEPGDLSCLSSIIRRDAVTFPGKGIG
ncbi:MAG: hypothetical protein M3Z96_00410 [Pseudomonadota bacterium]|nr:hypothetical protein [Pseudomonadota bacterium]